MTTPFKLACLLTGTDYRRALAAPMPSRTKVATLAIALALPTCIWAVSTYMLVRQVLQGSIIAATIAALVTGFIVGLLELIIVRASGSKTLAFFRVVLGLCAALIGAVIIDEILFKADVDMQMEQVKEQYAQQAGHQAVAHATQLYNLPAKQLALQAAQQHYKALDSLARGEADGTLGSGRRGVDAVTRFKQQQAQQAKTDYEKLHQETSALQTQIAATDSLARQKALANFNPHSLLMRIKALFELVAGNAAMAVIYAVFTLMMFVLEFLVILLKMYWPKTALETESEALELLHQQRTRQHLGPASPLSEASHTPALNSWVTLPPHFNTLL